MMDTENVQHLSHPLTPVFSGTPFSTLKSARINDLEK
jgi:hypothetical protein